MFIFYDAVDLIEDAETDIWEFNPFDFNYLVDYLIITIWSVQTNKKIDILHKKHVLKRNWLGPIWFQFLFYFFCDEGNILCLSPVRRTFQIFDKIFDRILKHDCACCKLCLNRRCRLSGYICWYTSVWLQFKYLIRS